MDTIHVIPAAGHRGSHVPALELRTVVALGPDGGVKVALPFQDPLWWAGAPAGLAPGDTVWAIWQEFPIAGVGGGVKALCVTPDCHLPTYLDRGAGRATLVPDASVGHYRVLPASPLPGTREL